MARHVVESEAMARDLAGLCIGGKRRRVPIRWVDQDSEDTCQKVRGTVTSRSVGRMKVFVPIYSFPQS